LGISSNDTRMKYTTLKIYLFSLLIAATFAVGAYHWHSRNITFFIEAENVTSVLLYGSFNGWSQGHPLTRGSQNNWSHTIKLGEGRYEYKYLIDGKWKHNPGLPSISDGFGGQNNLLIIR